MPKIDLNPLSEGGEIDTSDPTSTIMTLGTVIVSFAALFFALAVGNDAGGWLYSRVMGLLGMGGSGGQRNLLEVAE